jgi:hypothetical protein
MVPTQDLRDGLVTHLFDRGHRAWNTCVGHFNVNCDIIMV